MQIFYDHSFVMNLVCIDNVRNGILSMTCPPVNKLGTPFGPPTFGIMSHQTILGDMHSLSCNIYIYIYVGLCFVLSTRCRYDTVVLRQIQVFLALFEPLDVP